MCSDSSSAFLEQSLGSNLGLAVSVGLSWSSKENDGFLEEEARWFQKPLDYDHCHLENILLFSALAAIMHITGRESFNSRPLSWRVNFLGQSLDSEGQHYATSRQSEVTSLEFFCCSDWPNKFQEIKIETTVGREVFPTQLSSFPPLSFYLSEPTEK